MPSEAFTAMPAQGAGVEQLLGRLLPWLAALVAAVILLVAVLGFYFRRRMRQGPTGGSSTWTLQDLRGMRSRGQIDGAEFERLRTTLLAGPARDAGVADRADDVQSDGNETQGLA